MMRWDKQGVHMADNQQRPGGMMGGKGLYQAPDL